MKRRYKILAVLLAVVVIGFLLLPSDNPRRAVEAYKQQLRAKGEKLTMVELAPPTSSNGIIAGKAFTNAMEDFKNPSNFPPSMRIIAPGVVLLGHANLDATQMGSFATNTAKAAELRAVLNVPKLDFDMDYSQGVLMLLPQLAKFKNAETLFYVTTFQSLHDGNYPETWSDLTSAVDLVRFADEPIMLSDLVRFAMGQIAIGTSWDALQVDRWTDAQLSDLQTRWAAVDFMRNEEIVMAMERACMIDALAKSRKMKDGQSVGYLSILYNSGTPSASDGFMADTRDKIKELYDRYPGFWAWKRSWSYDEEIYCLQLTTAVAETARLIKASGATLPSIIDLQQKETNLANLYSEKAAHFLLSGLPLTGDDVYVKYFKKAAWTEGARRLLITAIALKRFEMQHGKYPAALPELVPAFLKREPLDPWDGQPMHYRLKPDGDFLLYSVGEDGQDNGGDPSPTGSSSSWMTARDVVWPRAATPAEATAYNSGQLMITNAPGK